MGPVRFGCPGDSGGPTVIGLDGAVFRVSSTIYFFEIFGFGRPDDFGDVVALRPELTAKMAEWEAAEAGTP